MNFLAGRTAEEAVKRSIIESLEARDAKICDTWDRSKALGVAYALKSELALDEAKEVKEYVTSVSGSELLIDGKVKVNIVRADVKERNEKAIMIVRYEHLEGF